MVRDQPALEPERGAHVVFHRAAGLGERVVREPARGPGLVDRKSTRLNSSHRTISYADFRLKNNSNGEHRRAFRPRQVDAAVAELALVRSRLPSRGAAAALLAPGHDPPGASDSIQPMQPARL